VPLVGHTGEVTSLAFDPDGKTLASGSLDHTARLWNVGADPVTPATAPLPHRSGVRTVAFSPDGRALATGSDDHVVYVFNTASGKVRGTFPQPETVWAAAFTSDRQNLVTGSDNGTARVWSLAVPTLTGAATSVAFSPDGRILATTGDGAVQLWDSTDPQRLTPRGHPWPNPPGRSRRLPSAPTERSSRPAAVTPPSGCGTSALLAPRVRSGSH
jgi:WD40 repeat protein